MNEWMTMARAMVISLLALLAVSASGQQLDGYSFPYEMLGLSDDCFAAVNTTVTSCPAWVARYAGIEGASVEILPSEQLEQLCGSSCRSDLAALQTKIKDACTAPTDVMVPGGSIAYPATFMADRYLYASSLSCLTDPSTKEYCDEIVADWMSNGTEYTAAQNCSVCELGVQQIQLASPFGYDDDSAEHFASLTSSCSATGYAYTTPTRYALNGTATATTTSTATPSCAGSWYTVEADDTCVTISGANNVSTYGLISQNALDAACNSIYEGRTLCLPPTCKTHQLGMVETCTSLMSSLDITMAQLLAWNPMINTGCSNLASWRGWYLCASSPNGDIDVSAGSAVTTAAPVPTDAQPETNTRCGQWDEVLEGDDCSSISVKYGISLADFYFLNPQVDSNCTNLWLNTSYCVAPVGNIATYSGYSVSTPSYTFTKPPKTTATPTPVPLPTLNPRAPDTVSDCDLYDNPFFANTTNAMRYNSCENWAQIAGVTVQDLISWNPSLSASNCTLDAEYSYCIISGQTPPSIDLPYDYCFPANTSLIPSTSVQPSDCNCYIQLRAEDKSVFNCTMFPNRFNVPIDEVTTLNPWIGSDCDTGVWNGLSSDGYEQICVEGSTSSSSTSTGTPTSTSEQASTSSTGSTSTVATPTSTPMPSEAANCNKWHTVADGDGCQVIADKYNISLSDFYKWNPEVGSDCSALWLGYAVCVGVF